MYAKWRVLFPIIFLQATLPLSQQQEQCNVRNGVSFTAYGWPDPSQQLTAFSCDGTKKLDTNVPTPIDGDGSYQKPYSAAAVAGGSIFPDCATVYIPYLRKYFRVVDHCGSCPSTRLDLYIANFNSDVGQHSCELAFGNFPGANVAVVGASNGFKPNTSPLFDSGTKQCHDATSSSPLVYPGDQSSATCSGGSSTTEASTDDDTNANTANTKALAVNNDQSVVPDDTLTQTSSVESDQTAATGIVEGSLGNGVMRNAVVDESLVTTTSTGTAATATATGTGQKCWVKHGKTRCIPWPPRRPWRGRREVREEAEGFEW